MVDKPDMSKCVNIEQYEKQIKHWQALKIEQLEAENKRLKEGLEVYADKFNWNAQYRSESKHDFQPQILMHESFNGYEIAQKALAE